MNKKNLIANLKRFKIKKLLKLNKAELIKLYTLSKKTVKELKTQAKELYIKGYYKLNKADLIKTIYNNKTVKINKNIINDIDNIDEYLNKYNFKVDDDALNIINDLERLIIYNKLRLRRDLNTYNGIIIQKPIVNVIHYKKIEDFENNKYVMYVDEHFNSILNYSLNNIFDNNQMIKGFGSIQAFYAYLIDIKDERGKKISETINFAYTKTENIFNDNDEIKKVEYSGDMDKVINFKYPASVKVIKLGYRVLYKVIGGLSNANIKKLKAFQPSTDREYHEKTLASTSTNKLCIYETFLCVIYKRELLYKRNRNNIDDLKLSLKNEGKDIEKNVKHGNLIESLILLTKKYDNSILIEFNNEYKYIIIDKGEVDIEPKNDKLIMYNNKRCMLYERGIHVAPFYYKYINKECLNDKKIKKDTLENNYKLRQKNIINNTLGDISIYGYDTETYLNEKLECVVYCITLYGQNKDKKIIDKVFYGENCINKFCDYIDKISTKTYYFKSRPKEKVENIYIYGFNNSNFDNLLIYDALYYKNNKTKYIFTNSSIKYIQYNNVRINDISLFYKAGSLRDTCKQFKLEEEKGVFPYNFVNKDNLYYIGDIPELKYWNSKDDYDYYLKNEDLTFNMKDYTVKYCLLDSKLVYELGKIHIKNSIGEVKGRKFNLLKANTGANISLKMFTQCFLDVELTQSKTEIIKKERDAYKGGRTEKFKNKFISNGEDRLYYFDINSSYPYSMTKMMPYKYIKTLVISNKIVNLDNLNIITPYNLYRAKYEYIGDNKNNIPNLLLRDEKSKEIIAINKSDEYSYHWGCEIIEAVKNNFKIIINEENEYEGRAIFKTYVDHFYNERLRVKKEGNTALSMFYKLLLNSLYGKFGQKTFTKSCLCRSSAEVYDILEKEDGILIGLDLIGDMVMIEYQTKENKEKSIGKLVRFSSYIASESRCNLSSFMREVGHENVYYCDTDSVFTSKRPSESFISSSILGKWKEETETPIIKACFIAPKTYTYKCEDNHGDKKCKGLNGEKLGEDTYYNLIDGKIDNVKQDMKMFFRSFENIVIKDQERTMNIVNNKRIWGNNESKSYSTITDWKKAKIKI